MNERAPDELPAPTDNERHTLSLIADRIIPPSPSHGIPGAGDEPIREAMIVDAGHRLPRVIEALGVLDELAESVDGAAFESLTRERRKLIATLFRERHPRSADLLERLAAQCYYRDPRVLASLGVPARAPHPEGFEVEQGDWSLLDAVRGLDKLYRPT